MQALEFKASVHKGTIKLPKEFEEYEGVDFRFIALVEPKKSCEKTAAFLGLNEKTLSDIWDNKEDGVYDRYL